MTTTTQTTATTTAIEIKSTRIIGTKLTVFSAWEPTTRSKYIGPLSHSTITSDHSGTTWLGRIGAKLLPIHLDILPALSDERSAAVRAWHASEYERAYTAILAMFPEASEGKRDMGEIEVWD